MIQSFRHKGLQRFYEKNERKGLPPVLVDKISRILARLDIATVPEQMALPALKLHPLKGEFKGFGRSPLREIGELFSGSMGPLWSRSI